LEIGWTYNRNHHRQVTIARLADGYRTYLRRLIAERPVNGVPRRIYREIHETAAHRNIEAIYPPAPGQAAMLAHSQQNPESEAYFLQWVYEIEGELDTAVLRQAWEWVSGRHEILRTLFVGAGKGRIFQVVLASAEPEWREMDWQGMAAGEQEQRLAAWLVEDRRRGFRPSVEPPLRFMVVRFSREAYRLVWSHHHALLDGWSMAPLWQEVLAAYEALRQGRKPDLAPPVPYRRYLDWVRRQPVGRARDYWQERLGGYPERVNPAKRVDEGGGLYGSVELRLTVEETAALQAFAQQNRLTLNTVVQGAWARALAHFSGWEDVVFGVTSAGRPPAIPGVERIVGLMLNTLPVRVRVESDLEDGEKLVEWLQGIQEQQAVQSQFEYVSAAQVQAWSGISAEKPLFESFLRFQNYPMKAFLESWQGSLKIRNSQVFDRWHFLLSVVVVPEEALALRIGYDEGLFAEDEVGELAAEFRRVLIYYKQNLPQTDNAHSV
jgi:hypothetical protein